MTRDRQAISKENVKEQIRAHLSSIEDLPPIGDLGDDEALEGILDSINMLELVSALEDRFSVRIVEDELGWENFSTINKIATFLTTKKLDQSAS
ncbi:MAG: acyl carrier protein [Pirellulales bacterium]|nr:acyl carrier protein [Pirellulales bacterium]